MTNYYLDIIFEAMQGHELQETKIDLGVVNGILNIDGTPNFAFSKYNGTDKGDDFEYAMMQLGFKDPRFIREEDLAGKYELANNARPIMLESLPPKSGGIVFYNASQLIPINGSPEIKPYQNEFKMPLDLNNASEVAADRLIQRIDNAMKILGKTNNIGIGSRVGFGGLYLPPKGLYESRQKYVENYAHEFIGHMVGLSSELGLSAFFSPDIIELISNDTEDPYEHYKNSSYSLEEISAQLTAFSILKAEGINIDPTNTINYMSHWFEKLLIELDGHPLTIDGKTYDTSSEESWGLFMKLIEDSRVGKNFALETIEEIGELFGSFNKIYDALEINDVKQQDATKVMNAFLEAKKQLKEGQNLSLDFFKEIYEAQNPADIQDNLKDAVNERQSAEIRDQIKQFAAELLQGAKDTIKKVVELNNIAKTTVSPIVLDLDGDGVKTTSIENGTYFDLDANGHAEKTAYVNPNDALLVRDLNKNGQIDSGRELIGNHTLLSDGKEAANGFEVLKELDGNKDGVIDAKDAAYHELLLFRDKNGNGIVDEGELISLEAAGIKSLNVAYKNSTDVDENGNKHAQQGSFAKTDGTTGQMNDVWFNADLTDTKDTVQIDISEETAALINIQGFGNVHDLHNALMLDTTGRLKTLVIGISNALAEGQSFESLSDQLNNFIFEWTGASAYAANSRGSNIDARILYALEAFMGQNFSQNSVGKNPGPVATKQLETSYNVLKEYILTQFIFETRIAPLFDQLSFGWNAESKKIEADVSRLLNSFKAEFENNPSDFAFILKAFRNGLTQQGTSGQAIIKQLKEMGSLAGSEFELRLALIEYDGNTIVNVGDASQTVKTSTDDTIVVGGQGNKIINTSNGNDTIILIGGNNTVDAGYGNDTIYSGTGNDYLKGGYGADTYVFSKGHGQDIIYDDGDESVSIADTIRFTDVNAADVKFMRQGNKLILFGYNGSDQITVENFFHPLANYTIERIEFADQTYDNLWKNGLSFYSDDLNISGWSGSNHIQGGDKNHTITTSLGNDIIRTGSGNNTVSSGGGNDTIFLGAGNNTVDAGAGDDTIYSGTGNDILRGASGSDTYIFSKGHGQDIINDNSGGGSISIDTIKFIDVDSTAVKFKKIGTNLILFGYNGTDQITIEQFFNTVGYNTIERFEFSDQIITYDDLWKNGLSFYSDDLSISGWGGSNNIQTGDKNHTISTSLGNDVIRTGSGNNTVSSGGGDDVITLGSGNNTVDGGAGDDTIYSGTGNDILKGNYGLDTYIFSKGHGQDIINDYSGGANSIDTVKFTDVDSTSVKFRKTGNSLILFGYNGTDQITIEQFFYSPNYYAIEHFEFTDKTITYDDLWKNGLSFYSDDESITGWGGINDIQSGDKNHTIKTYESNDVIRTGSGNNTVTSGSGNDVIILGSGNNTVDAGAGDDTIYSGTGNDILKGGAGSDTYIFSKGHGQDIINDYTSGGNLIDTVKFTDVDSTSVKFRKTGNSLILFDYNGTDQITIEQFFSSPNYYAIERFEFTDKTITYDDLWKNGISFYSDDQTITGWGGVNDLQGGDKDHTITTSSSNDTIRTGSGNNTVNAGSGNDTIILSSGNNIVNAGAGNDTIYSGTGNDQLVGWVGADTYIFSKGHGQDIVSDNGDTSQTVIDTIKFTDVKATEVKFAKDGNNLIIFGYNSTDKITVDKFFSSTYYRIELFEFSDSKITYAELMKQTIPAYQEPVVASRSLVIPQAISIEQEVQSMINAMASFGATTEGSIQVEDQTYGYLTPITVPNY